MQSVMRDCYRMGTHGSVWVGSSMQDRCQRCIHRYGLRLSCQVLSARDIYVPETLAKSFDRSLAYLEVTQRSYATSFYVGCSCTIQLAACNNLGSFSAFARQHAGCEAPRVTSKLRMPGGEEGGLPVNTTLWPETKRRG